MRLPGPASSPSIHPSLHYHLLHGSARPGPGDWPRFEPPLHQGRTVTQRVGAETFPPRLYAAQLAWHTFPPRRWSASCSGLFHGRHSCKDAQEKPDFYFFCVHLFPGGQQLGAAGTMTVVQDDFTPQKEIVYNQLLPYAERLDQEATELLADIKANLSRAVLVRELWPGMAFWCRKLFSWVSVAGSRPRLTSQWGKINKLKNNRVIASYRESCGIVTSQINELQASCRVSFSSFCLPAHP